MNIRIITLLINALLMIGLPILLAAILTRIFRTSWKLIWIGAGTFIVSQAVHIPFNAVLSPLFDRFAFLSLHPNIQLAILAAFYGLSAGLCEELARYGMYRWWAKDARSWSMGLVAGVGHGGVEATIFGILALWGWLQIVVLTRIDISQVIPEAQRVLVQSQLDSTLAMPIYMTILGSVERILTIPIHLACSLLVLMSFISKKRSWLIYAILFHALVDASAVIALGKNLPALELEALVGIFTIISVVIIFALRCPATGKKEPGILPDVDEFAISPIVDTQDAVDNSRFYQS